MNILVTLTTNNFSNIISNQAKAKLETLGNVIYHSNLNEEKYNEILKSSMAEIVITGWGSPFLSLKIYKENPQLKYLCHLAGSVRKFVDLEAIKQGLLVSNWGNVVAKSVAEGTLMMILSALRKTTYFQMQLHIKKVWPSHKKAEGLFYQRIGLYGFGVIAQELVKLLKSFECKISAYDPYCPTNIFEILGVKRVFSLKELFATNRIISLHTGLTQENYHIINKEILSQLENGGIIINTARGAIINTDDLIEELKIGRIEAALDVFEKEPLSFDSRLRGLENCQLIPHMAGPTYDRQVDMGNFAVDNIDNYVHNRPINSIITPEKYNLMT